VSPAQRPIGFLGAPGS